jgi:hypothetical protein
MRRSTEKTESVNVDGGRLNLGRIPPTSMKIKRQILARPPHQEEDIQGRKSSISLRQ